MKTYYKEEPTSDKYKKGIIAGCIAGVLVGLVIGSYLTNLTSTPTVRELEESQVKVPDEEEEEQPIRQAQPQRYIYTFTDRKQEEQKEEQPFEDKPVRVERPERPEPVVRPVVKPVVKPIVKEEKETPVIYINNVKLRDKVDLYDEQEAEND